MNNFGVDSSFQMKPPSRLVETAPLMHDPLTGLYNKFGFVMEGNRLLPLIVAKGNKPSVIVLDLNNYEGIIFRLSYTESMELLKAVGQRLERAFGDNVMLARFDSERFAALITDASDDLSGLMRALEAPLQVGSVTIHLSITCGIASYPDAADNMDMLIIAARTARQDAVLTNRTVGHYAIGLRQRLARRRAIEDGLWACHQGMGMSLMYQPKVEIRTGQVVGVETLLRWCHPELGPVSPVEFIPIAERTETIIPIGEWLTRETLRQMRAWRDSGHDITVAINVSPVQLTPNGYGPAMLDILIQECARLNLERGKIELEITEGLLTDATAMAEVRRLAAAGFGIAVDDFGRDHSALSLLVDCPARTLKIDKSFIDNIVGNERQLAVVRFIFELARRLGMQTVVEGVESMQQLITLAEAGCDYVQGFFYFRPMTGDQILSLKHKH